MSISFETVEVKISKNHSGLMRNGWPIGSVAIGKRAVLDGQKSSYVFLEAKDAKHGCEVTIGETCVLLSK